jgi:hypothetical protein
VPSFSHPYFATKSIIINSRVMPCNGSFISLTILIT